jgi:ubiquinone/menaquinone biosynthesis C-methylase UbiE
MKKNILDNALLVHDLFGKDMTLFDSVNELFELELALLESQALSREELIQRTAFFKAIDGIPTNHYLQCQSTNGHISKDRSVQTQAYFEEGRFSTGYATHGLFPYRGKFHPQLVKGLLNILSIKPGEIILDPMCGSGTLNVEASLLGIDSIGIDVSPFCRFMTRVKCQSLNLPKELLLTMCNDTEKWFKFFSNGKINGKLKRIKDTDKLKVYELALLAYLDAMGYARRVVKAGHRELFDKVLRRYQATVLQTIDNSVISRINLGNATILEGEARSLPIEDSTIDCIVTSPPYSFAIDYAENDAPQLEYLGYNVDSLRSNMLGLAGKSKSEKLQRYFNDMDKVVQEIVRVLKSKKFAILIIGSNTNQTGGIRLEQTIINHFKQAGAPLIRSFLKPIKGMRNTMKEEYILIFQKI